MHNIYNVLIVDDIEINLIIMSTILEENFGHNILTVQSAKEALAIIETKEIDLIISDVYMPQMDGFEFTKIIKSTPKTKDIPVILLSAIENAEEFQIQGSRVGAIGFISKPINNELFISQLLNYFESIRVKKELQKRNRFIGSLLNASKEAQIVVDPFFNIFESNNSAKLMFHKIEDTKKLNTFFKNDEIYDFIINHKFTNNPLDKIYKHEQKYYYASSTELEGGYSLFSFNDITSSHKETIRQETIFNSLHTIVVITDGKNLVNINKKFFDLHDYKDIKDFKQHYHCICEMFIEKEGQKYLQPIMEGMRWSQYIVANKTKIHIACIIDKFGVERYYEVVSSGPIFETGQEREEVIVFNDITEIKKQSELLQEQSRLASMGEMISMIAHQWRQPLTILSSINLKLKIQASLGELKKEDLLASNEKSNQIIRYLNKTIDDFRNFFKNEENEERLSLEAIFQMSLGLLDSVIKDVYCNIIIEYKNNLQADTQVTLSQSKFNQVLLNIVKNSLDEFKRFEIENPKIKILCSLNEKDFNIDIIDNAGGIPENIIKKIFDPYFSTKSKNGTGIGLYMSKIIIDEQMQGRLSVRNIKDGACFNIALPRNLLSVSTEVNQKI